MVLRGLYRGSQRALALSILDQNISDQKHRSNCTFHLRFKLVDLWWEASALQKTAGIERTFGTDQNQ